MLKITDLEVNYGAIEAVKGVTFRVEKGEIISLIGANGAGKTSILRTISALIKNSGGTIEFDGEDITKMAPEKIVERGLIHVPEGRRIFAGMTIKENLELGAFTRHKKDDLKADYDNVFRHFPRLKERLHQDAATMSGGEQQMLAIARALMAKPKILLLDEPSMGLAPLFITEIFNIIKEINDEGVTILLIEQNAKKALEIADRAYVLETGNVVLEGTGAELLESPEVKKAYLG
ncbi:MAG: ABC transporter ATP-binding protein [Lactobacillales bacterium]|jgi:branched-chain amino acid transport system ATP-binding protein|nr:ABC transporter ATP-binding protein [Lactobacillales bacterium]